MLDFPGRVASLVFAGGCNLTCPYCHNGGLVLDPAGYPDIPLDELLADLEQRKNFIDGVVVSGGEPTIDAGLPAFLHQLKKIGLLVKLDTNGLMPDVLAELIDRQLVDCVAVDIKTAPARYSELHTSMVDGSVLKQTVNLLNRSNIEIEYRTTCVPRLVGMVEIEEIGSLIRGSRLWVLQQFVADHAMIAAWQREDAWSSTALLDLAGRAEQYVERVQVRGI